MGGRGLIVVDASAIVAIIAREPGWEALRAAIDAGADVSTSAVSIFEASLALARISSAPPDAARLLVQALMTAANVSVRPLGESEAALAVEAHQRFGRGRHPAKLNMGDCFSYACARASGAKLLFKGDDFTRTDIVRA